MQKTKLIKMIALGIILLFIGVSYSSAISVNFKTPILNNESKNDCGCKKIDKNILYKIKNQINRLEDYNKLLLIFSKYKPELIEISRELSTEISIISGKYNEIKQVSSFKDGLFCKIVMRLGQYLVNISQRYFNVYVYFNNSKNVIFSIVFFSIAFLYIFIATQFSIVYWILCTKN